MIRALRAIRNNLPPRQRFFGLRSSPVHGPNNRDEATRLQVPGLPAIDGELTVDGELVEQAPILPEKRSQLA